ncbi:CRISPR-associated endonuclease Cas9 [Flavobacterium bizetiae]|uniref:CRISPR-associated endonuclease Cas9 n=1 Tax=Flavobacterium bizetiae TaxID=2704140 RepID=A0A6J4GX64_9FLAO|nr:type II CRISPR RNA-guided endonuclease Cas9 [Flavobacterium bizetiae]CAA9202951.1 CRISPR-associated endonuclease Cas9 [Flavobacterium bizetiae]CAD5343579.1 CRISPR-associated endonuclease Cas9 [Flavobacterium bizetiae]CAD5349574.1 CRISPR-associated endonuclease Cas9 [Flavobacterium bizetiae]
MKKILGLDLGTTSIGWAYIHEAENNDETSSIINSGVRIVPLTTDEESDFKKGNTISINADRTLKRGARRGLQRFKQRRDAILETFNKIKFISTGFVYAETGKSTTFSSYQLRAKAAVEPVSKEELVQVLLMLNKKRGYKSSRKAKTAEEGDAIDGMKIAKEIFENNLTPGQWVYNSLSKGSRFIPDFYRSDLQKELEKIVRFQNQFYPEQINNKLLEDIKGKSRTQTSQYFSKTLKIELAENKGTREETKFQHYKWRTEALTKELNLKILAFILTEINNQINQSSGYLGAISDRSKELYFNQETIGQFQYKQLKKDPHAKLKNQVFYRQDYLDEFEKIWETQRQFHSELNDLLKTEVRDVTIFYQRKLKSQKHLVSFCEFEKGHKTIPKSSPLFQEFRVWQNLNNVVVKNEATKESFILDEDLKKNISQQLLFKESMTDSQILSFCELKKGTYSVNFKKIEGNRTNTEIYKAFEKILVLEGYDELDLSKLHAFEINEVIKSAFSDLEINTDILDFDTNIQGNNFDKQSYYQFWHLLYSAEDDDFLRKSLMSKFGFKENHIPFLLNINLQADYGSLSAKAIKKVLPHLIDGHIYDKACTLVGYNHSSSLTTEQNNGRILKDTLELLKKNSLRNPVVEKILNQMINVINAVLEDPTLGKPDEIRVELARELKNNNEQRSEMTKAINKSTAEHEQIRKLLHKEFGIHRVTRNDIIRYRLWKECDGISLYTGKPIPPSMLFTKDYDIEHIIPKSRLFDDSFSNKTICERQLNIDKSNKTAYSFLQEKLSMEEFDQFEKRVKSLYGKISRTKQNKLLMADNEIPEGFIERQLRETQYIAKKAKEILLEVSRNVTSTIGRITDKLREDWELVDVMKELNWNKYDKLGLTYIEEGKNGERLYKIKDWTKRNDHRHHAMDAITVAFTKPAYIQYLNNLNGKTQGDKKADSIYGIEAKYLRRDKNNKLRFIEPAPNFREDVKKQLENILISYKAKNKVVTKNKNITKMQGGTNERIQLTPRGQLHKETVYGKLQQYVTKEEKVGGAFTAEYIKKVAKKKYREALLKRLLENENDPKKAFTGKNALHKTPVFICEKENSIVPEKVKTVWLEADYTIRKDITPDLKVEKVIDIGLKTILEERLAEFGNDPKKAFINLDENPIWQNKEKGIAIKRVTISGVSNAQALHTKKDHFGNEILDKNGKPIPVDFISTGNNHHVAIYKDEKGNLHEEVVSFYDAVVRKNLGLSVINKNHEKGWEFLFSMKQNEFFIFPSENFNPHEIDLLNPSNYHLISPNIFRVQKFGELGSSGFWFRNHLETTLDNSKPLKSTTYKDIYSHKALENIIKVRINHLGKIVQLGEY